MPKLVAQKNLGSAVIEQLRKNTAAVEAMPFLRNPPKMQRRRRCGGCSGGQITMSVMTDYESIKRSIVSATPTQKALIKQVLGAKLIRITYQTGGRVKTTAF